MVRAVLERAGLRIRSSSMPWKRAPRHGAPRAQHLHLLRRPDGGARASSSSGWAGSATAGSLHCLKERADLLRRPLAELQGATFAVIQGDASIDLLRKLGVPDANLHLMRDAAGANTTRRAARGTLRLLRVQPAELRASLRRTDLEGLFQQHGVVGKGTATTWRRTPHPTGARGRVRDAFAALQANGALKAVFERALLRWRPANRERSAVPTGSSPGTAGSIARRLALIVVAVTVLVTVLSLSGSSRGRSTATTTACAGGRSQLLSSSARCGCSLVVSRREAARTIGEAIAQDEIVTRIEIVDHRGAVYFRRDKGGRWRSTRLPRSTTRTARSARCASRSTPSRGGASWARSRPWPAPAACS